MSLPQLVLLTAACTAGRGATADVQAAPAAAAALATEIERPDWAWEISNHGRECFDASVAHKPAGATGRRPSPLGSAQTTVHV